MSIKAVCFDIDGTLYPKVETNKRLLVSFFPSPILALKFNNFRKKDRLESIELTDKRNEDAFRRHQASSIGTNIKVVEKQFYTKWKKSFANLKPYQSLYQALEKIKEKNLLIGALSDFPVEQKLKDMKIDNFFDVAICSEEAGYLKPHSHPFKLLSKKLELKSSDILYIGDSYDKDIVGSFDVGMKNCYFVAKAKSDKLKARLKNKYPKADVIISNYEELIKHLETLLI